MIWPVYGYPCKSDGTPTAILPECPVHKLVMELPVCLHCVSEHRDSEADELPEGVL